ncbi:MAG: UDP-N-acetylmuramoyl-tripeptide--D-alanyl-D-alanine ligase [Lachnospiraceae bacterium]|nr:UDP-N-acetylmuramoyl-tripeptide--D-alanyl-D-alanine ligase [Lachnospiraceae bacterium]
MKTITVYDVARATKGDLLHANPEKEEIKSLVTMDSRLAKEDSLFVAIKGERVDGHDFLNDVFNKGATAAIVDHVPDEITGTLIVVKDTVKALQDLAEWYRSTLNIKVVGITGSVGKTSTKEMIASVLAEKYKVQKTLGNYNNEIGLPLTILAIEEDTEIEVLEMGISDFGEMLVLSKIARPDICVITNIGQSHLENLGTRDGILKAKSEIFEFMQDDARVYLNGDDDKLSTIKDVKGIKPVTFGFSDTNAIFPVKTRSLGLAGTEMSIKYGDVEFDAEIHMLGNHMVSNAMAASAIALDLGMTVSEVKNGLKNAKTIDGRSNLIKRGNGFVIDDCYNAAPSSMKAAIDTLSLAEGHKTAILGDMFELGADSDKMHEEVGEYAGKSNIDKFIFVGESAKFLFKGAKKTAAPGTVLKHYDTVDALLENLSSETEADDNILLKASNGMNFKVILNNLIKN